MQVVRRKENLLRTYMYTHDIYFDVVPLIMRVFWNKIHYGIDSETHVTFVTAEVTLSYIIMEIGLWLVKSS